MMELNFELKIIINVKLYYYLVLLDLKNNKEGFIG